MLWIALYLPELPLQLAQRASEITVACVIAEGPVTRPVVRCANEAARECGVVPGMTVASARALYGKLRVLPHEVSLDAEALHGLACWAGQFTPAVVVQQGEGLLLEISTTLQLHGGLKALLARLRAGLQELGYHAAPGVAPTPLAAWLLAKARQMGMKVRMCLEPALLVQRLAALPLMLLDWCDQTLTTLYTLGVRSLGQCLSLPRDGFIRRFGAERRLELDRALGEAADPRPWFTPPDHFSSRLEFGFEVNDAMMLLFPLKRLLQQLEGFLRGRGAGVQQWQLVLEHSKKQKTCITLGVSMPERSAERLLALARERLAQLALSSTVIGLGIVAENLCEFAESSRSFVPDPGAQAIGWSQLMDKLSVRLGNEQVYRLRALDDHRPEQAWKALVAGTTRYISKKAPAVPLMQAPRPLWLLKAPRALLTDNGKPLCQGKLQMLAGPERVESGWWDGNKARRDYYVARNSSGETLWIYREHQLAPAWFLHGIFG
jgi:protein ImuB